MARLNTTTYQRRTIERLKRFQSYMKEQPQTILEVGPGGVLKSFSNLLGLGIAGRLFKAIEQILRRLPFLEIESFEPFEIYEVFETSKPELTVIDIHTRVLESIDKKNANRFNIKTQLHDIAQGIFPEKTFDAIVCNAVINWESQDYKAMIDNIVNSTKVGGYLFLATNFNDYIVSLDAIEQLDDAMYRRIA